MYVKSVVIRSRRDGQTSARRSQVAVQVSRWADRTTGLSPERDPRGLRLSPGRRLSVDITVSKAYGQLMAGATLRPIWTKDQR